MTTSEGGSDSRALASLADVLKRKIKQRFVQAKLEFGRLFQYFPVMSLTITHKLLYIVLFLHGLRKLDICEGEHH